jgi:hypothetical protein
MKSSEFMGFASTFPVVSGFPRIRRASIVMGALLPPRAPCSKLMLKMHFQGSNKP